MPEERWREVIPAARTIYQASSPTLAQMAREEFVKTWSKELPSAVACFEDDFDACIAHLRLPIGHRRVTRTTNLLERLFLEERRRTKTIPHAFGERPVLKLMYAAILRASQSWLRIVINDFERKQLQTLREELDQQFHERNTVQLKPTSHGKNYSKQGT